MTLRSDHVAGAFFIVAGVAIWALSGDLPIGSLSMPGSGFLPKIVATLLVIFGLVLAFRAAESPTFASLLWDDSAHAMQVLIITALGVAVFEWLGFVITMLLVMTALLVVIERRNAGRAAGYSLAVVVVTYLAFQYVLKTPLPDGPLGF